MAPTFAGTHPNPYGPRSFGSLVFGMAVEGCEMGIVAAMAGICDEFEHYGWRRVQAALRQQGVVVNHKKVRRLMCASAPNYAPYRRPTVTPANG